MKEYDFLIVGQGLAGSLLAYELWQRGMKILIFDQNWASDTSEKGEKTMPVNFLPEEILNTGARGQIADFSNRLSTASQIAAGLINPITGKRFVKSWRIDEFLPKAKETYRKLEQLLAIRLWHDRTIFRTIQTIEEENSYLLRKTYPEYEDYCGELTSNLPFSPNGVLRAVSDAFKPFHAFAEIKQAAQVNLPLFVNRVYHFFNDLNLIVPTFFDFKELKIRHENVQYQDYIATKIIFCEGAAAIKNPYFNWLPFNLDKGELLLVDIPNLDWRHILKHKIAIVPLSDTEGGQKDRYWVGATNDWDFENALPTTANRALIEHELENILQLPFSVVGHLAAIRPTVRDRRPFIGLHPNFASLSIFNGFGTKGASLVPYWAHHFVEVLVEGKNLDPEVSIERMYFDK